MEALILSCGTGGGHNAAGYAVKEELERRGHNVKMLDPYTLKRNHIDRLIDNAYIKLVQRVPLAFGAVYGLGNLYRRLPFRSPVYFLNRKMVPVMEQLLSEKQYDYVVMPHLYPAEILTYMKKHGYQVPKMLFIATDYTCIPFTEETECDTYVIPSDKLTREFVKRGIPKDRLLPLGIPVRREFAQPFDRLEVAARLGLDSRLHYILITGGSIGAGKLVRAVKVLDRRYHKDGTVKLIVICGNNRRLYHKLHEQYGERHIILQRTEQMPDYVKLCDVMVIKPGGLSSTEAAVTGKRLVLMTPIPGCESHNLHFFRKNGLCRGVLTPDIQLVKEVDRLMKQSDDCEMTRRQHAVINTRAVEDICDFMEQ